MVIIARVLLKVFNKDSYTKGKVIILLCEWHTPHVKTEISLTADLVVSVFHGLC